MTRLWSENRQTSWAQKIPREITHSANRQIYTVLDLPPADETDDRKRGSPGLAGVIEPQQSARLRPLERPRTAGRTQCRGRFSVTGKVRKDNI
ncbi:MAG: hypothetical protein FD143_3359 [Ignavibacteria bacterium]|nr:MAG: hypothetical protein FD143_3359 [Ignavibacteria bacterium]